MSSMDVVRTRKPVFPVLKVSVGVLACGATLVAVTLLFRQHGGSSIDRATIVTAVVEQGMLVRSVTAGGIFEPEHVQVVSAPQSGVVQVVYVKPGTFVGRLSAIARLDNPDLDASVVAASSALRVARANLASAIAQGRATTLTQQAALSDVRAQSQENVVRAHAYASLHAKGLVNDVQFENAQIEATKTTTDVAIAQTQLEVGQKDAESKIAAAQAQVDQASSQLQVARAAEEALRIYAGANGVVQDVSVEPGMRLSQGTEIARVADQHMLKAVVQVPESDAQLLRQGLPVQVTASGTVLWGRIVRIAPAAQDGTVSCDIAFDGTLPASIRPDTALDSVIELSRVPNALYVRRAAGAVDGGSLDLYKIVDQGQRAIRVHVQLGTGSEERMQILSGLQRGALIIISDTSNYTADELRLR